MFNKGDTVRIAQDSLISEWIEKEKTMYMRDRLPKPVIAIYLEKFYNDYMCKVIIGDKIRCVVERDLREIKNEDNKICFYHGTVNSH